MYILISDFSNLQNQLPVTNNTNGVYLFHWLLKFLVACTLCVCIVLPKLPWLVSWKGTASLFLHW